MAEACGASIFEVRCHVPVNLAVSRLQDRPAERAYGSEASADVARRLHDAAEAWPEATVISTDAPVDVAVNDIDARLPGGRGHGHDVLDPGADSFAAGSACDDDGPGPAPGRPMPKPGPAEGPLPPAGGAGAAARD